MFVVWDIDEVLAQMGKLVVERLSGKCRPLQEWDSYAFGPHLYDSLHPNRGEVETFMRNERLIEECLPFPQTKAALEHVIDCGYRNIAVSARAWHPSAETLSFEWFERHGMGHLMSDIVITDMPDCKVEAIHKHVGKMPVVLFVEDSAANATKAAHAGIRTALVTNNWNVKCGEHPLITRVSNAYEAALLCRITRR